MISRINRIQNIEYRIKNTPQSGVTLILSILILASLLAISFSLATVLFIEVRSSQDLLRTEGSLYGATGVAEQAMFNLKRQVCTNNDPSCLSTTYSSQFTNNVILDGTPALTTTSTPIFQDKVLVGKTFSTTTNKYDFCDPTQLTSGCGYGKVTVSYISTGHDSDTLYAYLCEFDPNASEGAYQTLPPCSTVGYSQGYWKQPNGGNFQTDGSTQITADTNPSVTWDLDSTKQQQLIFTNPSGSNNIYFSVKTFGPYDPDPNLSYTPKGLPFVGKSSIIINTTNGPVGRKIQVIVPR